METCNVFIEDVESNHRKCIIYRISEKVPARIVLYMLSWSGFIVSFMMRTDINIAIVAMVKETKVASFNNTILQQRHCHVQQDDMDEDLQIGYEGTLDWSPKAQSYVLAAFYWAYIITQLVGSWATQKFGTKRVFGYAQFATALCSLCIPWASEVHYGLVILLKSIQGLASGPTWPAMYAMVGHWIPMAERSRFISSFQGISIGLAINYPLCGVLIAHLGWRSVFYMTGSLGLLWCLVWYLMAFDRPEIHPRISVSERQYIKENTINSSRQETIPWAKIFTSKPAWAIAITTFGRIWIIVIFITMGPRFMKTILGFNIQKNGLLSGAPYIFSYIASTIFCYAADKLIIKNWISLTNVRKLFTALSQLGPGCLIVLIPYLGCNVQYILVFWFIAIILCSAAFAGVMVNPVDITPNFSGPVIAFAQTIQMIAGFLSPLTVGYLTEDGHTLSAWKDVFNISAVVAISTYIVYHFFGTGKIQSWNENKTTVNSSENEIMLADRNIIVESTLCMNNGENKTLDR